MLIIDRIILAIYTLAMAIVSLGVVVLTLRLFPEDVVWTNLIFLISRWETGGIAALFMLISLRLFKVSFSSSKLQSSDEAIVIHGTLGDVRVAIIAIKNLVDKVARSIKGVRDVKINVNVVSNKQGNMEDTAVRIKIKIVVGPESNVPEISDQMQQLVKDKLKNTVGIDVGEIDIVVENISNATVQKQRVI
jgi:uncharacterized alkaline shock family protein YloU